MNTMKTTIVNGIWVKVPAQLNRLAGKWEEVVGGVKMSPKRNGPVARLDVTCYTPDDRPAVRIDAPWSDK